MANTQGKNGNHFSLEPLVHDAGSRGGLHVSADAKRVALVIALAVASFLTVYFLSAPADDVKTQLRFADDGSTETAPTSAAGTVPSATPTSGSLAYNGFPELSGNANGFDLNGNQNGIASTVIRNAAPDPLSGNANGSNGNGNANTPSSGPMTPRPTIQYFTPTPTPLAAAMETTPTPTATPAPSATPTPEPIKRGMEQSGPATWMALLPVLMVGVFRLARKRA